MILFQQVLHWEENHKGAVATAVRQQERLQNQLISALEQKVEELLEENECLRVGSDGNSRHGRGDREPVLQSATEGGILSDTANAELVSDAAHCRIAELEKMGKLKVSRWSRLLAYQLLCVSTNDVVCVVL